MLFNLLLPSIAVLLCFFLSLVAFNSFFTIPVEIENARLKLARIPTGAQITVANNAIEMLPGFTDKAITCQVVKRSNIFIKSFAHWFSFFHLSNKIIFNFIEFA